MLKISDVICINRNTVIEALESNFNDKEDAVLYHGALAAGMNYFVTRDPKDFLKFASPKLPVVNVKALLKLLKAI